MGKKVIIAAIIVLALIAVVGYVLSQKKLAPSTATNTPSTQVTQSAPTEAMPDYVKAMQGSGEVKCTYEVNGVTQTSYIKNGTIRMEITTNGVTNNTLMLDKIVYSWPTNSKTGFMMDTSKITTTITPSPGAQNLKSEDSLKKDLETYHPQCSNESIPDSMFEKPAGVTFSDMSKMMDDIKSKIPANVTLPPGVTIPQQ